MPLLLLVDGLIRLELEYMQEEALLLMIILVVILFKEILHFIHTNLIFLLLVSHVS
jgi:hypothetical protein